MHNLFWAQTVFANAVKDGAIITNELSTMHIPGSRVLRFESDIHLYFGKQEVSDRQAATAILALCNRQA